MRSQTTPRDTAVSPVVGVILVVAVTVVLSIAIGAFVFDLGQSLSGASDSESSVAARMSEQSDGMYVTILSTDESVDVLKNGDVVYTFNETELGQTVRVSGLNTSDSVSLRKNGSTDSLVMSETVGSSIPLSGDGAELVGGSETPTATILLVWNSSSEWDAATSSGVEHSSLVNAESVRIGRLEDDGDVSEYTTGTNDSTDVLIKPDLHETVPSEIGLGPYARHIRTNATLDNYSYIAYNYSQEVSPDRTTLWLKIPKPDANDWVFNFGFHNTSGDTVTRVAFDGYSTKNVSTLNGSGSGWTGRGDYPANTWFKVVVDWDWTNDSYELFVDGTSYGVEGFRSGSETGTIRYFEMWDYRNGGIDGYVDHQLSPYTASGSITTANKTAAAPLDVSTLQLKNVSHALNGQGITVYVESDADGDGIYEETSTGIALDGSASYSVTGLSTNSKTFRLRAVMSSDSIRTPQLNAIELSGDEA